MLKILFFFLAVIALAFGFSRLADTDGSLALTMGDRLITVDLIVAAIGLLVTLVVLMLIWWLIRVLLTSPSRLRRHFRARKRDRGYQALSTGIIAAGAGDAETARRMLKQADNQLVATSEPLIALLDAQTTMLEGRHDEARVKFETMLEDPETRSLALRGLYLEAQRLGDRDAQRHYAQKAVELAPQLAWAGKAAVNHKTEQGDWEGALRIVETQKSRKQISRTEADRKRAVLLTAQAMELVEAEPARAKSAALEAHKIANDFAPAAVTCAEAALRLDDMRRAVKVLETCWKSRPHPDVALAYVNARPGDSAVDRLKRARRLESLKPNTTESSLIVAQMALEAGEFDEARKAVGAVLRNQPRQSAYLLMADIEAAETGNQGKMREWLARAVHAPRDPAWTTDGFVSQTWAPFSPVTGELDAFEWKVPVERLGGPLIDNGDMSTEASAVDMGGAIASDAIITEAMTGPIVDVTPDDPEPQAAATPAKSEHPPTEAQTSQENAVVDAAPDTEKAAEKEPDMIADTDVSKTGTNPAPDETQLNQSSAANGGKATSDMPKPDKADTKSDETFKAPIPDDPGIEDGEPSPEKSRFRLF